MAYYYVPTIKDAESGIYFYCKDDNGTIVRASSDIKPGIHTLKLDREIVPSRYVLDCPESQDALSGWEEKTAEEVNTDYPGLIQGV